jgi:hypothetical protein
MVLLGTLCGSEGNCVSEAMVSNGGSELSASESKYSSSYAEFSSSDAKKFILVMDTTCHAARSIPP